MTALALGILYFYVMPLFEQVRVIQEETNEYREAIAQASEFNQKLNSLITARNNMSAAELERMDAFLGENRDETELLVDLEAIAQGSGMFFGNVGVEQQPDENFSMGADGRDLDTIGPEDFTETKISFQVIGTYEQFRRMLRDLERSLVLFEVQNISYKPIFTPSLQQFSVTVTAREFNEEQAL